MTLTSIRLPAVLPLLLSLAVPAAAQQRTDQDRLAREIFRELVEINTTQSEGSTAAAARAMAKRLLDAGFLAEDVVVVENAPRKGNLVARYRGRATGRKPVLLLAHIDVVEAKPEDWTLPPFEFIERDGTFYGRGVADDKDEAAIHIANLIRLKREGYVPERDIIVALTTDEEGGPDNGVEWILANRPELFDAAFAINEGGGGEMQDGKRISNTVQASEKKVQNFTLEVTNPGGHSSRPVKDNAITHLSAALVKIGAYDFPVRLNEVTREFFTRSAAIVEPEMAQAMRAIVADETDVAAAAALARDPAHNSRMRTTCVATLLEGGHASNALPQRARANVNCRILPDETPEAVRQTLETLVADPQVHFIPVGHATDSPPSPLQGEVLAAVEQVSKAMWPDVPVVPVMSTGATDGLYLRNRGIPTYGVSGLFYGETFAHGMNERIPVESFYQGLEFLYRLTKTLTSGPVS